MLNSDRLKFNLIELSLLNNSFRQICVWNAKPLVLDMYDINRRSIGIICPNTYIYVTI